MIQIEKIIPGGQALGVMEDGKKVFFWNALPGEIVADFQTTKTKSHYIEAIATKIEQASQFRIRPQDSCFLSTSPWQIMNYDYELQLKQDLVVEFFREHQISLPKPPIFTDHKDFHYRNKMEYSLYWDNEREQISLAFHQRGSHRKIPIQASSIERPEIFTTAKHLVEELNDRHAEARQYQSILLRCNQDGKVSGGLYENGKPHPVFSNLTDKILNQTYSYSPNGFFQINLPVYEMALQSIKENIDTTKILDLYSGVGTIGLSVARDKHLTLVECDKSAFGELLTNIRNLDNQNIFPILAKSEEVLDYIEPEQTVILDPPRAGCDNKLLVRILEQSPRKVIYLSCNPATQARDVKILLEKYQITEVKTFNFFPRTPHIENLIILELK